MTFLFPAFALGLAALAIPILLHLRRKPPTTSVTFSTLMFLEKTPVRPRSRRRLEDWLLLLLRCLALALLALMFMRPFFQSQIFGEASSRLATVILLDRSASMRGESWTAALKHVDEAVAGLKESDAVSFTLFDREPNTVMSFDEWQGIEQGQRKASLSRYAKTTTAGWGGTDLGKALTSAVDSLNAQAPSDKKRSNARRIILISDLQEGSALNALNGFAWPEDVNLSLLNVPHPAQNNFTLALAASLDEAAAPAADKAAAKPDDSALQRVRITNSALSKSENFTLAWQGEKERVSGILPAGISRVLAAPPRLNQNVSVLEITGDAVDFDNRVFIAPPHPRQAAILCIGAGLSRTDTASPLFYVTRALLPSGVIEPVISEKESTTVNAADLSKADFVIICDGPNAQNSAPIHEWLKAGHSAIFIASEKGSTESLATISGLKLSLSEASSANYSMLSDLQYDHPVLQPFAEAGVRDFTKIRFWKHRKLSAGEDVLPASQILARFDDGSIALAEIPVGKGRVIFLASGWQPSDSQLAVSSKFVPLLYSILDRAGLATPQQSSHVVGDAIARSEWIPTAKIVTLPGGKKSPLQQDSEAPFTATDQPGIYTFGEGAEARVVAVNLAPNEGRIAPLDPQRLRDLGVRFADGASAQSNPMTAHEAQKLADGEREQSQKLWKWLALAALAVLFIETWLAGRRESRVPDALPQPS